MEKWNIEIIDEKRKIKPKIPSFQHSRYPAPSTQHPTPNTQHSTPNTQHPTFPALLVLKTVPEVENQYPAKWLLRPFGVEYAWRPSWRFWERLYVRFFGFVDLPGRLRARLILPEVLAHRPRKILDYGFGTGCYSFYLSRDPGIDVSGVELDSTRIRESDSILERLKRENLTFSHEGQNAPLSHFPAGIFDLTLAVEVLQYIPHIQESLRGIYHVLKPGGHLLGHVPMLGYLRPKEVTLFSDEVILRLLEEAGFGNIRVTPTFHGVSQKICHIYEKISHSKLFVTLLFPWLLLASLGWKIQGAQGDYRFFTAQKPMNKDRWTGEPSPLEERAKGA